MKYRIVGAIVAVIVAALASTAHACDCTLPANYGNKQCQAAITAALNAKPTTTQTQGQGQGQSQSANSGSTSGAGVSVGNTTATSAGGQGGSATGGSGGQGGTSSAAGGAGGTSASKSAATASGGIVGNTSAATGASTSSSTATGNGGSVGAGAGASTVNEVYQAQPRAPVNTAVAGFQQTTAGCYHGEGIGFQLIAGAASGGFTFLHKDCEAHLVAQDYYARGQFLAGDTVECHTKYNLRAFGSVSSCMTILAVERNQAAQVQVRTVEVMPQGHVYTQQQVDAIVKKVVSK